MANNSVLPFREDRAFFSPSTAAGLALLLDEAMRSHDPLICESLLLKARSHWPEEPDAHISLYKFYFVAGRYAQAEAAVWQAMRIAAELAGFNRNYRLLDANSAQWADRAGPVRLYLFSLKALGVCRLRRGRPLAAYAVLSKLVALDPSNEIGGSAFCEIARSFFDEQ